MPWLIGSPVGNLGLDHPVKEDVEVEDGDVVTDDDVGIKLADLGHQVTEQSALGLHLLDLEHHFRN